MKKRKAVYAASLDPITNGHINVIERMAPLYDELIVLVAVDSRKTYTLAPKERVNMTAAAVAHLKNVSVDACIGGYVVKQADKIGAHTIIRGLRNFKDMEDEQILAEGNRRICPHIETVWIPCRPELAHVSSSMVKGHVGADPSWEEQVARSVPAAVVTKLKENFVISRTKKHWAGLMALLGNPKGGDKTFEDILMRYSEKQRAYHVLEHIINMLDELETTVYKHNPALILAIWLHDIVYDPRAKDNEEQSVSLAKAMIQMTNLPRELGERVGDLILATKHHTVPTDPPAQVLVDLDLTILGKPEKEFDAYEVGIRKEYRHVSERLFRIGRSDMLRSFLERPSIYSTQQFRKKYERTARTNLKRSLAKLQK